MTTQTVLPDSVEMTRKAAAQIEGEILRQLAEVKQTRAADGISQSSSGCKEGPGQSIATKIPVHLLFVNATLI